MVRRDVKINLCVVQSLPWYTGHGLSSSEDLTWPPQMEMWWEKHTMPILRQIITARMGVSQDSPMLRVVKEEFV
jgi:hypothetical protein